MESENLNNTSCPHKKDEDVQLNAIAQLCKMLEEIDIVTIKFQSICYLNYAIMDMIDFINCLTESCIEETRFILDDKELIALRELQKSLHTIRHDYYYTGTVHHRWLHCDGRCDDCKCSEFKACTDCAIRIQFMECLDSINVAHTLLTNAVKRYQLIPESFA
jgi:hypothetical protein